MHTLKGRRWHVQSAVATQGLGLYEGLDWLSSTLKSLHSRGVATSVGTSRGEGHQLWKVTRRAGVEPSRHERPRRFGEAKDSYRFHSRRRGSRRRLRHATSPSITTSPSFTTSSTRRPRCDPRPIPFPSRCIDCLLSPPATAPRGSRGRQRARAIEGRRGRPPPRSPVSCRRDRARATMHPPPRVSALAASGRDPLGEGARRAPPSSPRRRCRRARRRLRHPPPRVRAFASSEAGAAATAAFRALLRVRTLSLFRIGSARTSVARPRVRDMWRIRIGSGDTWRTRFRAEHVHRADRIGRRTTPLSLLRGRDLGVPERRAVFASLLSGRGTHRGREAIARLRLIGRHRAKRRTTRSERLPGRDRRPRAARARPESAADGFLLRVASAIAATCRLWSLTRRRASSIATSSSSPSRSARGTSPSIRRRRPRLAPRGRERDPEEVLAGFGRGAFLGRRPRGLDSANHFRTRRPTQSAERRAARVTAARRSGEDSASAFGRARHRRNRRPRRRRRSRRGRARSCPSPPPPRQPRDAQPQP